MQYEIGCTTWGYPIIWQREVEGAVWRGCDQFRAEGPEAFRRLGIEHLCLNWNAYEFTLWLQQHCRVNDWVYTHGAGSHNKGWYKVRGTDLWHIRYMQMRSNTINFLNIAAHADLNKDIITFREGTQWQDHIKWKLYGF